MGGAVLSPRAEPPGSEDLVDRGTHTRLGDGAATTAGLVVSAARHNVSVPLLEGRRCGREPATRCCRWIESAVPTKEFLPLS